MNMDLVLTADRIPAPGESYFGETYHTIPGGKGANQAVAAARLGATVTFAGRVGNDSNGRRLVENLAANGIDTAGVTIDEEHPTGLAVIIVEPGGANRIMVYPGANMRLAFDDVRSALSGSYDAIMMNFEIPDDVVFAVTERAAPRAVPVVIDAGPARSFELERLGGVEVLSPNETETEVLTGMRCDSDAATEEAARALRARSDARLVIIKLGERGSLAYDGRTMRKTRAFPVEAVDATAAGDAFTAGFAVRYFSRRDLSDSLRFAAAAGAIAVTRLGAQPSLPSARETEAFLDARRP